MMIDMVKLELQLLNLLADKRSSELETEHYKLSKLSDSKVLIETNANLEDFKLLIAFSSEVSYPNAVTVTLKNVWLDPDSFDDTEDKELISKLLEKKLTPMEALVIYYFMTKTNKGAIYKAVINTNILEKVEDRNVSN
jgi:hypothetical protein